ncbi:MAG: flagellar biosynthetic protein FliO [Granulosicoccus sp.]
MNPVFAAFLLLTGALAPWASVQAQQSGAPIVSPLATLSKLAIALIIVLIVFWLFAKFMKQMQGGQGVSHDSLKVVGTLSLGQRERVVVVQAGKEQLILGVTSSAINTLHVLETPISAPDSADLGDFKEKLSAALKRQVKT